MKEFINFLKSRAFFANLFLALLILLIVSWLVFKYLAATTAHGESIEVPQLVNKSFLEAQELLIANNLDYEVIDSVYEENKPKGIVLEQLPPAFDRVKGGRTIYLTINARSAPKIEMPDLVNQSLRQAGSVLNLMGLKYETEYRPDICTDCVLEQHYRGSVIAPGTPVAKGETILLILGISSATTIPSFPDTVFYEPVVPETPEHEEIFE